MKKNDTVLWLVILLLIVLCACQLVFIFSDSKKTTSTVQQSDSPEIAAQSEQQPEPRFISFSRPHESTVLVPGETIKITGQIAGLFDGATKVKITDSSGAVVVEQPVLLSQTETSEVFNWSAEVVVPTQTALGLAIISTEFISAAHSDFDFTSMREIEIAKKPINQSLDGTWQLVSTLEQDGYTVAIPEGIQIQMTLNEGKITGRSACNSFTGSYTVTDPGSLAFGPLATTRMACQESSMNIEFNQLRSFDFTASYVINSKNELRLFDAGDGIVATYTRVALKN